MEKNLGHATAYGYAKSKGYSGTEDEFAELMADYASVGQSAAQSAEQAAASATSASGSAASASQAAQTATSKASEAVTAAGTATTKASEASTSADTASAAALSASTSAQTATTAASTATTKADEAAASEAAALSAKTDAESARDAAAQSASAAAESARTLTIDATLTQSGQAADAKKTGDAITGLKEGLTAIAKEYVSVNLFDGGFVDGYRSSGDIIGTESNYACSTPIYLKAGSYLFPSTERLFGANAGRTVFVVNESGVYQGSKVVGTVVGQRTEQGVYYSGRDIIKFDLSNDCHISINVGRQYVAQPESVQVSNFMLVAGETIDDFPMYTAYFAPYYGLTENVPLSPKMETQINGLSGLYAKTAIFDGDSICAGTSVGADNPTYKKGWAGRIGEANNMTWKNYGVNGGIITSASASGMSSKHSVVDTVPAMHTDFPNADFIVFEGGTNDADNHITLGTITDYDFSGNYDRTTFCGALETIFYKAINYWKGKAIGFIIAHRMGNGTGQSSSYANRRAYFDQAKLVCRKWGIPCLDLWDGCYLDPHNPNCYNSELTVEENIAQGYLYVDSQHLTAKGYDYISPMIEAWMKTL